MKTQSWMFAALLALLCASAAAQDKKASAEAAQAAIVQRAEALTEDQIKESRDIPALSKLAQIYEAKNDTQRLSWILRRVSELMPNSGNLKLQLALAYAGAGDKTHAYDTLMRMQVQGFGYDISADPRFEPIHGTRVWDYIVANLQVNAKPFGEGGVTLHLPKTDNLLNALAWDPKRKSLIVGSARDGSVHLVDDSGKTKDFIPAGAKSGAWGIDALAVDAVHDKLYAATSSSLRFSGFNADNANKSGVAEFDLSSGKFLHMYTASGDAGPRTFNSLAVSKDGQLYVADGKHRTVFKLEGGELKPIVQNAKLTDITAITVSDDGRTLYLADYAMGIFGFDLSKGAAFELKYNPTQLVLGGIVGMHWYDNTLVIIEDDMVPKRVMRLKLAADGQTIASAMPLDVANPAFTKLGDGAIAGDKLYFVANRQDDLYDAHGVLVAADKAEPESIFRSNLRFAWNETGKTMQGGPLPLGDTKDADKAQKPGHALGDDKN